jgi:hypothetical protein
MANPKTKQMTSTRILFNAPLDEFCIFKAFPMALFARIEA